MIRTPIHRKPNRDPVTSDVAAYVIARDIRVAGGCVPKHLGAPGECRDQWGAVVRTDVPRNLRLNHVRPYAGGGRPSVPRWMNAGCWYHNVQGWELTHVDEIRGYLARVEPV